MPRDRDACGTVFGGGLLTAADEVPVSRAELHLYNLRHVQHGAAQLNLLLRQAGVVPPGWVKPSVVTSGARGE